jgi:Uma2 family endonuclease
VPEYWFVDLDADRVEVYRIEEGRYARPVLFARGDTLGTPPGSRVRDGGR